MFNSNLTNFDDRRWPLCVLTHVAAFVCVCVCVRVCGCEIQMLAVLLPLEQTALPDVCTKSTVCVCVDVSWRLPIHFPLAPLRAHTLSRPHAHNGMCVRLYFCVCVCLCLC